MTLTEALEEVAQRSIYEGCTIVPTPDGYRVEDTFVSDSSQWWWTYKDGVLINGGHVSEASRLFTHDKTTHNAQRIAQNLPNAIRALGAGHAVSFVYVPVFTIDRIAMRADPVGWIIFANILEVCHANYYVRSNAQGARYLRLCLCVRR